MTAIDPSRSTVVAWYAELPDALAQLVARIHTAGAALLGDGFAPRDPAQIHATVIGLERATATFDPGPLAAHLHAALAEPLAVQFGGFFPDNRGMLSRGRAMHERTFLIQERGPDVTTTSATGAAPGRPPASSTRQCSAVLVGWPVVDGVPRPALAELRDSCAALGVTHRYGTDPDVYLVIADVTDAPPERCAALETTVRAELAADPVQVPLGAADLHLVTYTDPALPRRSSRWRPLPEATD